MTKDEKKTFVKELTDSIAKSVCDHIDEDSVPAGWDGHELRVMLADAFDRSASMSVIRSEPRQIRSRDYHNTMRVRNLD